MQVFNSSSQPNNTLTSNKLSNYENLKIRTRDGSKTIKFKFRPPEDVRKRQFCSMAQKFGFPNATEFALVVEGMTQAQRRACLERWYRDRREMLLKEGEQDVEIQEVEENVKTEGGG